MIFVNDDFVCERTFVGGKEVYNINVDTPDKIFNTEALKAKVKLEKGRICFMIKLFRD